MNQFAAIVLMIPQAMFEILEADIVVMQETKIQRKDLRDDMVLVPGWDVYFSLPKHKKGLEYSMDSQLEKEMLTAYVQDTLALQSTPETQSAPLFEQKKE
jgi:hypothetical protein